MLNLLTNFSHPELVFAVHQCTRFCNYQKRTHAQAVRRIIQYLISTRRDSDSYQGLLFKVDKSTIVNVYVDASFAGEWNTLWSENPLSVFSRTGYIITYTGCPISWLSKIEQRHPCPA